MSWISVEDRLPETDGKNTRDYNVLVYIPKREGCRQHGIYVGKLANVPADDGSGNFWGLKTESSKWIVWSWGYYEHPVITHWMPLPAPPGKDNNVPTNEPLTIEQLREMDGEPVWFDTIKRWGILKVNWEGIFVVTKSGEYEFGRCKVYRRPPEGESDA